MISDLKSACFHLFFYVINIIENAVSDINTYILIMIRWIFIFIFGKQVNSCFF